MIEFVFIKELFKHNKFSRPIFHHIKNCMYLGRYLVKASRNMSQSCPRKNEVEELAVYVAVVCKKVEKILFLDLKWQFSGERE